MVAIENVGNSPPDPPVADRLLGLHRDVVALANLVRGLDIASFETPESAPGELLARTQSLLRRAIDTFDLAAGESGGAADATGEWPTGTIDHARLGELGDVAFLAAAHLRTRLRSLSELGSKADRWILVGTSGSALRHTARALAAVESRLARATGGCPAIELDTELGIALQLRRRFADLRDCLRGPDIADSRALEQRLRRVGGGIAVLIGKPAYSHARIPDRIQLRALQTRVLAWLRSRGGREEGERLLQDIACFLDMLRLISRRQELVAHDQVLIEDALEEMARDRPISDSLFARLDALRGRDVAIDRLLAEGERSRASWWAILRQLGASSFPGDMG